MSPDFTEADLDRKQQKPRPKGRLPYLPDERDNAEELRAWLTLAFRPREGWHFDAFERPTTDPGDGCSITFRNGRDIAIYRFRRQSDLMGPKLRPMVLSVGKGALAMPHLTAGEIEDVWAALCTLGAVLTEYDECDETRKLFEQMLVATFPLTGHSLVPDGRFDALMAIRAHGEFTKPDALALVSAVKNDTDHWLRRPIRFVDKHTGEQWVRAGEAATYLRWVLGADPLSGGSLKGRLHEIGVEARYFQDGKPPHPKARLYRLSPELVEFVGGGQGS